MRRKYNEVPRYTTVQMEANDELQSYSFAIEGAIGSFDKQTGRNIGDDVPIGILEKLLDKFHFKDEEIAFDNELLKEGYKHVEGVIESDLHDISEEKLVKVLAVLHHVAKRRTRGHREYLAIVEQFVGERIRPGMRTVRLPPGLQ